MLVVRALGDWADDAAYADTGGAASDAKAGSTTPVFGVSASSPNGPTLPGPSTSKVTAMPWASIFTNALGQGNTAAATFNQSLAQVQAGRSTDMTPYILGAVGIAGVGFLAWLTLRK